MRRTATALAALALAAAAPALAEPNVGEAAQAGDQDVVVTGQRLTGEQLHKEAAEFVKRIGVASGHKPAARWAVPVCPAAYGIVDWQAAMVVAQVRDIAKQAGIAVARKGCTPNLGVMFSADGSAAARDMVKRQPARFEEVGPSARQRLLRGDAPIRWWYSTEQVGKDGRSGGSDSPIGVAVCGSAGFAAIGSNGRAKFLQRYNSGIVSTETIRAIESATVVIDVNRTKGLTMETVTNYAALVGLAEISPLDPPPGRSILALFTPDPGPNRDLTE